MDVTSVGDRKELGSFVHSTLPSLKVSGAYFETHKCLDMSLTSLSCSSLSWPGVTEDPNDPSLQD